MPLRPDALVVHATPYFAPAFVYGGPPRSILGLCEALTEQQLRIHVVTTTANGDRELSPHERKGQWSSGMSVTYLDRCAPVSRFNARGLAATLHELLPNAALVHIHGCWNALSWRVARACLAGGVPYVLSPRGMLSPWSFTHHAKRKKLWYAAIDRRVLANATGVHATSEGEASELRALMPQLRIAVVANGIEMSPPVTADRVAAFRSAFGIPQTSQVLLYAGRLHPKKGLEILFDAFARVGQRAPGVYLVLAGPLDAEYAPTFNGLVAAHPFRDRIVMTELLDRGQLEAAYAAASVFAFPSRSENFGLTVAEAMAAGVPIVVSRDTFWEDIQAAGAGFFVEGTASAFAHAIESLLSDPTAATAAGARGAALARQRFNWSTAGAAMHAAYDQWLNGTP